MATPTLTLINDGGLTDGVIADAETITGWTDFDTLETDIKVEGTYSIAGTGRANDEDMYFDNGGAPVTAVGKVYRAWFNTVNTPYMGTLAGTNPYELYFSDGTTATRKAMLGSDTYGGGWAYIVQDMDLVTTGNGWSGSPTLANIDVFGITTGHDANAKNVDNCWHDVMRYMDGYYLTGGTSGDKVTMADLATYDMDTARAYGIVQESRGIFFCTGTIQVGNGATTTYFDCTGEVLQFIDTIGDMQISAGLYEISATGSGCDCTINTSVIRGAGVGASTRIYFDFSDTNHALTFTNNLIVDGGTIQFADGQTCTGNTFDDCGQITAPGTDLGGSVFQNYEGTADTSYLVWNVATDPGGVGGELDGCTFTKGTAATHAIEFGTSAPESITLNNVTFNNYGADTTTSAAVYVKRTSGTTTISWSGGTAPTYKSDGATVVVQNTVTLKVTVVDQDGDAITSVQTAIYDASDDTELMNEDTVAGGVAQESYSYSTDTPVYIRVRKSSTGTTRYYNNSTTATITNAGLNVTITMRTDEIAST